jgi:hypothetical protein
LKVLVPDVEKVRLGLPPIGRVIEFTEALTE